MQVYTFAEASPTLSDPPRTWLDFVYINDKKHIKMRDPISSHCDCPTCARFSRGYLRHLAQLEDSLFYRLATIHNLSFMRRLTDLISQRTADDDTQG